MWTRANNTKSNSFAFESNGTWHGELTSLA